MNRLVRSALWILALLVTATLRAGMTVTLPPGDVTNGYFTIQYGLGSPAPGKIAYIYVTDPNGSYYEVAQAENVSDMSQTAYLYASLTGTYTFHYEYSYSSQGIPLTDVTDASYYVYQNNLSWSGVSAPTYATPYSTVTISATVTNMGNVTWNSNYYVQLSDGAGNHLAYASVSGLAPYSSTPVSFNVTIPNIGGNGTATYNLQGVDNGIQYFGPIQSVSIKIDYPPSTSLSASPNPAALNSYATVTSTTSAAYANLINQAIDYIPPGGGSWVSGSAGAGTRWDGGPQASDTLSPSLLMSTAGTWQFRARGQDSVGQLGAFAFFNLTVNNATAASFSGSPTTFTYNGSVQGPAIIPSPSGASYTISSGSATGVNVGNYSMTVTATGSYSGSSTINWSITPASQPAVAISPSGTVTCSVGQSVTFSASGGAGTGAYVWGGSASGTGATNTVTFNSTGTFTVTVYRVADSNYSQSATASVTVTVTTSGAGLSLEILRPVQ